MHVIYLPLKILIQSDQSIKSVLHFRSICIHLTIILKAFTEGFVYISFTLIYIQNYTPKNMLEKYSFSNMLKISNMSTKPNKKVSNVQISVLEMYANECIMN